MQHRLERFLMTLRVQRSRHTPEIQKQRGFVKNLDFEKKVSKTDLDFCFWSALSSPVFPTQSLAHLSNRQDEPSRGFIRKWTSMYYKFDFSALNGDKFDLFWREKEKDNKPRCSSAHLALQATPWKGEERKFAKKTAGEGKDNEYLEIFQLTSVLLILSSTVLEFMLNWKSNTRRKKY